MNIETEFRAVWQRVTLPVRHQFITLARYPIDNNQAYVVGVLWALEYAGVVSSEDYKYLLSVAGQLVDNLHFRTSFNGWVK